jgi:hypothetical protein
MYRVYEDLGIGEYHPVCIEYKKDETGECRVYEYLETRSGADADILILKQSDVIELNEWIEVLSTDSSLKLDFIQLPLPRRIGQSPRINN